MYITVYCAIDEVKAQSLSNGSQKACYDMLCVHVQTKTGSSIILHQKELFKHNDNYLCLDIVNNNNIIMAKSKVHANIIMQQ